MLKQNKKETLMQISKTRNIKTPRQEILSYLKELYYEELKSLIKDTEQK